MENIHFLKSSHNVTDSIINLFEVIQSYNPRSQLFKDAIQKGIDGLKRRKTWKVISKFSLASNASVLGARLVLTIKMKGSHKKLGKLGLYHSGTKIHWSNIWFTVSLYLKKIHKNHALYCRYEEFQTVFDRCDSGLHLKYRQAEPKTLHSTMFRIFSISWQDSGTLKTTLWLTSKAKNTGTVQWKTTLPKNTVWKHAFLIKPYILNSNLELSSEFVQHIYVIPWMLKLRNIASCGRNLKQNSIAEIVNGIILILQEIRLKSRKMNLLLKK